MRLNEEGSPTAAYRQIDLHFADYDAASSAATTAEAQALFPCMFGLATRVRILFSGIEEA